MKRLFLVLSSLFFILCFNVPTAYGEDFTATAPCVQTQYGAPGFSPTPPPGCDTGSGTGNYALKLIKAITNDSNCQEADGTDKLGLPTVPNDKAKSYGLPTADVAYTVPYFRRVIGGPNCLDPLDTKAASLGLTNWQTIKTGGEYLQDIQAGYLQCIGFANAVLKGANNVALTPEYNAGDYQYHTTEYPDYQWYDNKSDGSTLSSLKPGDALIFSCDPSVCKYGHIAVAVKVVPGSVFVAEGNGKGFGEQDIFPYNTAVAAGVNGGLTLVGWFHKK